MNPSVGVALHNPTSDEHGTYDESYETIQTGAVFFTDDARELIRREVRFSMHDEWDFYCTHTQAGPFEGPYAHAQDPHFPSTNVEVVLYPTEKFPSLPEIEQFNYTLPIELLPDKNSSYALVRNMKKDQKIKIIGIEEDFGWVPVTDSKLVIRNLAVTDLSGLPVPMSLQVFSKCNESRAFDIRIDWAKANQVASARGANLGLSVGLAGGITEQVQNSHQVSTGHAQTIRVESPAINDFRTIATPLVLEVRSHVTYELYEKSLLGNWNKRGLDWFVMDSWFIPTYSQSVELRPCSNVTECPYQRVTRSRIDG